MFNKASSLALVCLIALLPNITFAQKCKLVSVPLFDFGSPDKSSTDYTLKHYATLWCIKDVEYKLTVNSGNHPTGKNPSLLKTGGNKQIRYLIDFNEHGVGKGKNVLIRVPITIKIPASEQQGSPVGKYSDRVKLTLHYE